MYFSHQQKETERLGENLYRVTMQYDLQDEAKLVIRILSFGPVIRVTEFAHFIGQLRSCIN